MKKKLLIAGVGGTLALAMAAFAVVAMAGVPARTQNWEALRGTEGYYTKDPVSEDLPDITVNLKGSGGRQFISVGATVVYRLGPEIENAAPLFAERKPFVVDSLTMLFSGKTYADTEGADKKEMIKEEIKQRIERLIFPEKTGRVEEVLFRQFYVQ